MFELYTLEVTAFVESEDILACPHFVTCLQMDGLKVKTWFYSFGQSYGWVRHLIVMIEICVRTLGMRYVIDCPHKDGRADMFVCVSE